MEIQRFKISPFKRIKIQNHINPHNLDNIATERLKMAFNGNALNIIY